MTCHAAVASLLVQYSFDNLFSEVKAESEMSETRFLESQVLNCITAKCFGEMIRRIQIERFRVPSNVTAPYASDSAKPLLQVC